MLSKAIAGTVAFANRLAALDVFPEFSAKVRRLFYNPLGVLILAALAALVCGLFLHPQGFVLLGGVTAVIVLGIVWPWVTLRGMRAALAFEQVRASEGDTVQVCLTLRNRLPWAAWGLAVSGGFDPARDSQMPVASIASAPPRRTARCRWSFLTPCRGVYPLLGPRLTTGFPFGLWHNKRPVTVEAPLLVWPRTFPVGPVPLVHGDQQIEGNVARTKVGSSGDVLGVRPYRRGDSPRRIHWGQSARHDRLIICELQSNARPIIQVVLDADARQHAGQGAHGSREWAIRIVASLAKGWLEAGAQVAGLWNGQVIPAASGGQQLQRLLDGLAQLPDAPGPTLADIIAAPAFRGFGEGLQVIVTTDRALASLGASVRSDDRQHWLVLVASGFAEQPRPVPAAALPLRPWLLIESAQAIPAQLRSGWKEARHGS